MEGGNAARSASATTMVMQVAGSGGLQQRVECVHSPFVCSSEASSFLALQESRRQCRGCAGRKTAACARACQTHMTSRRWSCGNLW